MAMRIDSLNAWVRALRDVLASATRDECCERVLQLCAHECVSGAIDDAAVHELCNASAASHLIHALWLTGHEVSCALAVLRVLRDFVLHSASAPALRAIASLGAATRPLVAVITHHYLEEPVLEQACQVLVCIAAARAASCVVGDAGDTVVLVTIPRDPARKDEVSVAAAACRILRHVRDIDNPVSIGVLPKANVSEGVGALVELLHEHGTSRTAARHLVSAAREVVRDHEYRHACLKYGLLDGLAMALKYGHLPRDALVACVESVKCLYRVLAHTDDESGTDDVALARVLLNVIRANRHDEALLYASGQALLALVARSDHAYAVETLTESAAAATLLPAMSFIISGTDVDDRMLQMLQACFVCLLALATDDTQLRAIISLGACRVACAVAQWTCANHRRCNNRLPIAAAQLLHRICEAHASNDEEESSLLSVHRTVLASMFLCIRAWLCDPAVLVQMCGAIAACTSCPWSSACVEALCAAVREHPHHAAVHRAVWGATRSRLTHGSAVPIVEPLRLAIASEALLSALQTQLQDAIVAHDVLYIIKVLLDAGTTASAHLKVPQLSEMLAATMRQHARDQDVVLISLDVLAALMATTASGACATYFADARGISALVAILRIATPTVAAAASRALHRVIASPAYVHSDVLDEQIVRIAVGVLGGPGLADITILDHAVALLRVGCTQPAGRNAFFADHGHGAIQLALRQHMASRDAVQHLTGFLSSLRMDVRDVTQLHKAGVMATIVTALSQHKAYAPVVASCCQVLARLQPATGVAGTPEPMRSATSLHDVRICTELLALHGDDPAVAGCIAEVLVECPAAALPGFAAIGGIEALCTSFAAVDAKAATPDALLMALSRVVLAACQRHSVGGATFTTPSIPAKALAALMATLPRLLCTISKQLSLAAPSETLHGVLRVVQVVAEVQGSTRLLDSQEKATVLLLALLHRFRADAGVCASSMTILSWILGAAHKGCSCSTSTASSASPSEHSVPTLMSPTVARDAFLAGSMPSSCTAEIQASSSRGSEMTVVLNSPSAATGTTLSEVLRTCNAAATTHAAAGRVALPYLTLLSWLLKRDAFADELTPSLWKHTRTEQVLRTIESRAAMHDEATAKSLASVRVSVTQLWHSDSHSVPVVEQGCGCMIM